MTRERAAGTVARHALLTGLWVLAVLAAALVLAYLTAGPTGSLPTFAVVQTVVALLGCLLVVRVRAAGALRTGARPFLLTGVPALAAFVAWPVTWSGRALLGWQLGVGPVPAYAVDVLLWCGAVGLGVLWATTQVEPGAPATRGYA